VTKNKTKWCEDTTTLIKTKCSSRLSEKQTGSSTSYLIYW